MLEGAKEKARKDECVKEKVEKRMGGKRYATKRRQPMGYQSGTRIETITMRKNLGRIGQKKRKLLRR